MKFHYINILLFALPLNILIILCHVNIQRNHKSTIPLHTQKIPTNRSLCECELYMPNYDNDPQMKEVMENFNKQTQQRFEEYDEHMVEKRKRCKDKCDKESQKIILKDKLEKELMDKFATLHTDIQSDAISTCICETSIADKVEKGCLKCTQNMGGIVAPSSGVLAGIGALAVNAWKTTEISTATQAAIAKGAAKGAEAGIEELIFGLKAAFGLKELNGDPLDVFITTENYFSETIISGAVKLEYESWCKTLQTCDKSPLFAFYRKMPGDQGIKTIVENAEIIVGRAVKEASYVTHNVTATEMETLKTGTLADITAESSHLYSAIGYSVLAIIIIVLIMVIIYKILRYRRKKKMKKKLQYIKLLEE